jgi:hypothetical protein
MERVGGLDPGLYESGRGSLDLLAEAQGLTGQLQDFSAGFGTCDPPSFQNDPAAAAM